MKRIWRAHPGPFTAHVWELVDEDNAVSLCGRKLPADDVPRRADDPAGYCVNCERAVEARGEAA